MNDNSQSIDEVISQACGKLKNTAKLMGLDINYELDSIPALEDVITTIRDTGNEGALKGACFMTGAFLGEILRRKLGGQWISSAESGALLSVGEEKIFPIEKVRKFAADSESNSLTFFAKALVAKTQQQVTKAKAARGPDHD